MSKQVKTALRSRNEITSLSWTRQAAWLKILTAPLSWCKKTHRIWQKVHLLLSENQVVQDSVHQYYDQYVEYLLSAQLTSEPSHWIEERSIAPSSNIPDDTGIISELVAPGNDLLCIYIYILYTYIVIHNSYSDWHSRPMYIYVHIHIPLHIKYTHNNEVCQQCIHKISRFYKMKRMIS